MNDPSIAIHAGWLMAKVLEELAKEAKRASHDAQAAVRRFPRTETRLLEGDPHDCLGSEIARIDATLAVVGAHGHTPPLALRSDP